jgi:hypothetical protein
MLSSYILPCPLLLCILPSVQELATKEEKRDLLRMALEGVYVDMQSARVVAIKPEPAFLLPFNWRSQ